jgi:hypothetical protein
MPVYNERETLRTALDRLLAVTMPIPDRDPGGRRRIFGRLHRDDF